MSDIRPFMPLNPSALPQSGPAADVRQAQAAFFRQALAQVDTVQPVVSRPAAAAAAAPAQPSRPEALAADRPLRPGSYLDITV